MFWGVGWPPRVLPNAPLVPIASTSRYAIKYPMTIFHHTQDIRLYTCPWPTSYKPIWVALYWHMRSHTKEEVRQIMQSMHGIWAHK